MKGERIVQYHRGLTSNSHLTFECGKKHYIKTVQRGSENGVSVCVCEGWVITDGALNLPQLQIGFGVYMFSQIQHILILERQNRLIFSDSQNNTYSTTISRTTYITVTQCRGYKHMVNVEKCG